MIEMIRALLCMTCLLVAAMAFMRADWRIYRTGATLFVVAVMAFEVFNSVNAAATHVSDVGLVRKVGWPVILAAILVLWHGRTWLASTTSER